MVHSPRTMVRERVGGFKSKKATLGFILNKKRLYRIIDTAALILEFESKRNTSVKRENTCASN